MHHSRCDDFVSRTGKKPEGNIPIGGYDLPQPEKEVNPSREPEPVKGEGVDKLRTKLFTILDGLRYNPHGIRSDLYPYINQIIPLLTSAIKGERERVCKRISEEIEERCFGMSHIAFSTLDEVIEKLRKGGE